MRVINLGGGPGIGKSTTAAALFCAMKLMGLEVELISEYAKQLVWDKRHNALDDQLYILAKQNRKLAMLEKQVDYVVTDSPLYLCAHYGSENTTEVFKQMVIETYNQYSNVSFCLPRGSKDTYSEVGREQTYEQALEVDKQLYQLRNKYTIPTIVVKSSTIEEYVNYILHVIGCK
jgi:tRNA uridine 5-carbamoylmethylation protein Kti12